MAAEGERRSAKAGVSTTALMSAMGPIGSMVTRYYRIRRLEKMKGVRQGGCRQAGQADAI